MAQKTTDTRTRAEQLFHEWLELSRHDAAPERASFLASQPDDVRGELSSMLADYERLRQELGDGGSSFQKGRTIGDFRLLRELGRGGMGVVWEAEQESIRRKVALKLLFPHHQFSEKSLQRFHREAEAGGRLAHQGIVQVYAVGEADSVHYMAQELVSGGYTLADSLADLREEIEVPDGYYTGVAKLFIQVAEALAHAHEEGVVHRDIKPSNILISEGDRPKVADFGMARVDDQLSLSRTGEFMGTPFYMSPEQVASKRMGLDHRTDVFSLGATLYESLTLIRPFSGDTSQQVFQKILTEDPPDPRELKSRVPRDLAVIALKALEKSPESRFATMQDFADDLQRFLDDEPIRARPPGIVLRVRKWIVRHPTWSVIFGLGGTALLVIAMLGLKFVQKSQVVVAQKDELERANDELMQTNVDLEEAKRRAESQTRQLQQQSKDLKDARDLAVASQRLAEESAEDLYWQRTYLDNVRNAAYHLERGNAAEARNRLEQCPPEYRGWEWAHLSLRSDRSALQLETPLDEDEARGGLTRLQVLRVLFSQDGSELLSRSMGTSHRWDARTGVDLGELPRGVLNPDDITYDANGRLLAAGDQKSSAMVWDALTGAELVTLEGHDSNVNSVALDALGERVVTSSTDGTARVWDVATGAELAMLSGHGRRVSDADISPDGRFVATCSSDRTVRIWDAASGEELARFGNGNVLRSVAIAPDGRSVISESQDSSLQLWHVGSEAPLLDLPEHPRKAYPATFGQGGALLATGMSDGSVHILSTETGALVERLVGEGGGVHSLAFSPDGRLLAAGSDGPIYLMKLGQGAQSVTLAGHGQPVGTLAFSPDGKRLASGSGDGSIRVWDTLAQREFVTLKKPDAGKQRTLTRIHPVTFGANGRWVASGERERSIWSLAGKGIRIWDAHTGELNSQLRGHEKQVSALCAMGSDRLVSGSLDGTVRVWDVRTRTELAILGGNKGEVHAVAYDERGGLIAAGGDGHHVRVWSAETFALVHEIELDVEGVEALAFSPDGRSLYGGASDGEVRIWEASTGEESGRLVGLTGPVTSVAVSPDSAHVAVGGSNGEIRLYQAAFRTEEHVLTPNRRRRGALAPLLFYVSFSPDGKRLVSGSMGGILRIWDVERGEELAVLEGPSAGLSYEEWDPQTGRILETPAAEARQCSGVVFSPDGKRIVSANPDGSVRFWESEYATARGLWEGQALRETARALLAQRFGESSSYEEVLNSLEADIGLEPELRAAAERAAAWRHEGQVEEGVEPLVRRLFHRRVLMSEVMEDLRSNTDLTAEERAAALSLARRRDRPSAVSLYAVSHQVLRRSDADSKDYAEALQRAEVAAELEPGNPSFLSNLGLAQYRVGDLEACIDTLTRADRMNRSAEAPRYNPALDLGFLAMARWRQGSRQEARELLSEARVLAVGDDDEELIGFLGEAYLLITD